MCIKTRSTEVFSLLPQPLPHLIGHHLRLSNVVQRISRPSSDPLYATNTSSRKKGNISLWIFFALSPFAHRKLTTERSSSVVYSQARSPLRLLKPAYEHMNARLLSILSCSWTVLLPSDTHRKPIMSITAVLQPYVTYLLTLARMITCGLPQQAFWVQKKLQDATMDIIKIW
jgi:hypothetical protein